MTRKPNSKNTKAEILEAYKELLAERNALEKEMKQMN
ncbi:MAG: chorismate mutase, partial [Moorea sp. SIO3I7]|nr:chorismate mutase [Moorena sp. SIO3I7]